MTREEYMTKLQKYLRKLPKQDYEDAIEYFNEYFSDTDEEGQQRLMEELGTPKEAAADLMYNLLDRKIQEQDESGEEKKSKKGITLLAVLAIMSTPVTVPLFIAMLAVLLAAAICVVCVIFSDFIAAFSILLVGGKLLLRGLVSFPYSLSGALMITGCGLLGIGCAILLYLLGIYLCKWTGMLLVMLARKIAGKRGKNHEKTNKRLLVAGGILCAIGVLFLGVGVASGGKNYVKTADLNRISGNAMMDSSDSHVILSKTKINSFSSVNVDLRNLDLDVKESDDENFYIAYNIETNKGMLPLSYQVQDDTLNLVEKKGNESYSYIHIDINFLQEMLGQSHVIENSNKVTVYIPKENDMSSFSCKMGYGDLDIESLNAKQAVIQNDDGDVKIVRGRFKNLELKDDLGDLKIKDVIFANSQIEMADGDIQAENVTFTGKNEIRSSLGDITLSIPEKTLADLSVEAEASEINIPEKLGKVMTDEDDEQSVDSGNKAQNSLEIKSEDGDITIKAAK